ncbi:DUF4064 domain-containing protein [Bacillus carboniphilus]|uniref:DUF4064 domain-containing protein n=1 Tax=Bacillus carboniphilus TaxID=86663 RepID=A0ABN0VUR3_9BACI
MSRTTEFVLGLLGGIFGFFGAFFALFVGGIDAAFNEAGTSELTGLGFGGIIFSILGIIGSVRVKSKPKQGGIIMLIAAIGGLISISLAFLLSFILLLIAGLMGVFRKDKSVGQ